MIPTRAAAAAAALLLALGCGRDPGPPPPPAAPPATPDAQAPASHDHDHDDDGPAHEDHPHLLPDPPIPVNPALPAWAPDDAPEAAITDRRAQAWLAELAEGLDGRVDPAHGVLYDADGAPRWLAPDALGELDAALRRALSAGAAEARCRGGVCLVVDGATRWFLAVRRHVERGRILAAALRATDWPTTTRYLAWLEAARDAWQAPTFELLGQGLSAEETAKYGEALGAFAEVARLDPDNPWPAYYTARVHAARREYEDAYIALRLMLEQPAAVTVNAQLRLDGEHEFARFRTHTAVSDLQRELRLPPPTEVAGFLAYLQRFRASSRRLEEVLAPGGPGPEALARLLEARLLDEAELAAEPPEIRWRGARLTLTRDAEGALRVAALSEE